MAFVEPPKGITRITDLGDRLRIEIPLRPKGLLECLLLLVWLIFTGVCEGILVSSLLHRLGVIPQPLVEEAEPAPLPLLLFAFVVLGVLLSLWLWILLGREIVEVSIPEGTLKIRSLPFKKTSIYRLSEVANLRVLENLRWRGGGTITCIIAFDYGASTVRFGLTIDPAEARQIVALLKERFGQYMADGKVEAGS
jgi:hypothetical protein